MGNPLVISLDGGSTTGAIAAMIAKSVKTGMLSSLSVVTNSLPAALELTQQNTSSLQVFLAGGLVRPSSLAVVSPRNSAVDNLKEVMETVGQVDIAFVGTSGLSEEGLSTQTGEESRTKRTLLAPGAKHVIVTDPSKFGRRRDHIFASLENLHVITAREEGHGDVLLKYKEILEKHNSVLSIE
jgi:DeoR family fructose operon transcriptional repressor